MIRVHHVDKARDKTYVRPVVTVKSWSKAVREVRKLIRCIGGVGIATSTVTGKAIVITQRTITVVNASIQQEDIMTMLKKGDRVRIIDGRSVEIDPGHTCRWIDEMDHLIGKEFTVTQDLTYPNVITCLDGEAANYGWLEEWLKKI